MTRRQRLLAGVSSADHPDGEADGPPSSHFNPREDPLLTAHHVDSPSDGIGTQMVGHSDQSYSEPFA